MKMQKTQALRHLSVWMAILLALLCCIPVCGLAETRTVRVGVFPLGHFHNLDANGEPYGYDVDYIAKTAEYSHWTLEYVTAENWADALAKLDNGEIDLLAPAQKTPEREATYLFSAYSMSVEMGAVQVLADRTDLVYGDYAALSALKFGAMQASPLTTAFVESYCADAGFTPELTLYDDATSMYEALYNGEVDAVATNIMLGDERVKMVGRYSPAPVYYITRSNETALMRELDEAMTELVLDAPGYQNELFATYFSSFSNVLLTFEEQAYIASLPVVTVGYEVNHAPVSYTDEQSGQFAGITRDLLDRISQISGVRFKYVALPATDVSLDYLQTNHINVLCNVEYNAQNIAVKEMRLSSPYLTTEKVMLTARALEFTSESHLRVAVATGSRTLAASITEMYPNFEITTFATVEECLQAVLSGSVDASLQNRYIADCELTNPAYASLNVVPISALMDKLCIATLDFGDGDASSALFKSGVFLSVIDKAIKQLPTAEINDVIIRNTAASRYQTTLWDMLRANGVAVFSVLALVIALILMLLWRQRTERLRAKEMTQKNRALQDAVCQADKANQAKSGFLARMSHEIRTPMNAIVGITAIAKQHEDDPEKVDDYLDKIAASSKVLLGIINDVLDMSAIESNKIKISSTEFDIKQVLSRIATVYYPQCVNKHLTLQMGNDLSHELLIGDSLRVEQILMNLVSNAYKFTPEGGVIRIDAKEMSVKGDVVYLRFTVSDTGIGMTPEMLSRLFKPFEQESAQTAQKHGGSGLGMSIAKNLVDMMHGAIKAESEKDKGTTFTVDLPFHCSDKLSLSPDDRLKNVRALVVDDDPSAAEYTSVILDRIGVRYDIAKSGEEAVQKATIEHQQGSGYDICFVDWCMPRMDGVDVTRQLRRLFDKDTLIIIISAFDTANVQDEAFSAGANLFVTKPLFQSTVFNLLMQLSGGKYVQQTVEPDSFDFTGHRVLLAEDNALNREIAIELLHMVNMEVDCAVNGQEAVDRFNASKPNEYEAILMDIQMPLLDGYQATAAIRAGSHPCAATVPIFAMTANAFTSDVSASISAGMNGHISKPIDTAVLYQTLATALHLSPSIKP